jgi:hypothetical protein
MRCLCSKTKQKEMDIKVSKKPVVCTKFDIYVFIEIVWVSVISEYILVFWISIRVNFVYFIVNMCFGYISKCRFRKPDETLLFFNIAPLFFCLVFFLRVVNLMSALA